MTHKELWRLSASQLAQSIKTRSVSSREVIEAHLARIALLNPRLNALTQLFNQAALAQADRADTKIATGETVGPLHGVPFTIKESIDLAGAPPTQGVAALQGVIPPEDAPAVARLKAAGAIPLDHTNLPDFQLRWHTDSSLYGPTFNPWDKALSPGGSSGGEAVAVATGMSPLGLGGDYSGSLRLPFQANGIACLKPSRGRIASAG